MDGLLRLKRSQAKPAAEVLARAFYDDPLFAYFFPDAEQRKSMAPQLFEFWIRHAISYGEVYTTSPNLEGIIVCFSSRKADRTIWRIILSGSFPIYARLDKEIALKRHLINDFCETIRKRNAPPDYWYLEFIGIAPEFQGKGYASSLIKPMLARLDKEHLPCYLETENEDNVALYRRYGFELMEEASIPGSGLKLWAMLRENTS